MKVNGLRYIHALITGRLPFLALLVARGCQLCVAFAVSVTVVWGYGLSGAGTLALAALPSALCALVTGFGLQNSLPRMVATQPERATAGLVISSLMTIPCVPAVVAYGFIVGHDMNEAVAIAALAIAGGFAGQVNVQQSLYVLQGRSSFAPLTPVLHLVGTGAAATMPTLEGFALVLVATRAFGCLIGFIPLAYARLRLSMLRGAGLSAARYAPIDVAGLLADQLPVLLLSVLLSRPELGLYGLVRQFVAVADTPGWSYVASQYPVLVDDMRDTARGVARNNERISWLAGSIVLALASAMALFVYRAPGLLPLLPIVLLPLPARYLANFCDQCLRASGHVIDCLRLAAVRAVLALALSAGLTLWLGLWGAVAASSLLSLASGLLFRGRLQSRFPGLLGTPRPWLLSGA